MPALRWILVVVVVCGLSGAALAQGPAPVASPLVPNYASFAAYAAPAGGGPAYGALGPACCDCSPRCCANIWDGYCQEKLHGTAGCRSTGRCRSSACCRPQCSAVRRCRPVCSEVSVECSAAPAAPAPVEETPAAPAPAPKAK
ncbi:MAG: hypothetical protein HUU20_04730 [Pirellulales bacterium]|nr:hypothetical protein [Pirellulales bacterium]